MFIFVLMILLRFVRLDMLKTKKGVNILRCRWGKPRGKSCLVRISLKSRRILDEVPEKFRRDFLDSAILAASCSPDYLRLCSGSSLPN